ncbi:MAG TPA: hypothetical protein VIY28_06825 [Pseudonocardiaceae bacterium]
MARKDTVVAGVVALVLVVGLGLLSWLLWPDAGSAGGAFRTARGTVLQAAQCGQPDAQDALRVELPDGSEVEARLDGCGHRPGEVLAVEVPDPLPAGNVVARLAGTGVPASAADAQRLAAILVGLAGIAGAVLAWRLHGNRS